MNLKTKINLLLATIAGHMSKADARILEAALSEREAGTYKLSTGSTLITSNRSDSKLPMRAIIRPSPSIDQSYPMGVACTQNGAKLLTGVDQEVTKIVVEFNRIQKEKYVGSDKEVRGNSHLRGRNDKNSGNDSTN